MAAWEFIAHMNLSVVPPIFRLVFSRFGCRECHGSSATKLIRLATVETAFLVQRSHEFRHLSRFLRSQYSIAQCRVEEGHEVATSLRTHDNDNEKVL